MRNNGKRKKRNFFPVSNSEDSQVLLGHHTYIEAHAYSHGTVISISLSALIKSHKLSVQTCVNVVTCVHVCRCALTFFFLWLQSISLEALRRARTKKPQVPTFIFVYHVARPMHCHDGAGYMHVSNEETRDISSLTSSWIFWLAWLGRRSFWFLGARANERTNVWGQELDADILTAAAAAAALLGHNIGKRWGRATGR